MRKGQFSPAIGLADYDRNKVWSIPGPYITTLSPTEEAAFQKWASEKGVNANDPTYDNRGFWKGLMSGDPRAKTGGNPADQTIHGPDTWKTPYHESFSNESIYAMPDAPKWKGSDQGGWYLEDKHGNVIFDERRSIQREERDIKWK